MQEGEAPFNVLFQAAKHLEVTWRENILEKCSWEILLVGQEVLYEQELEK